MHSRPQAGIKSFFEPKSIAVAGVSSDPAKLGSIIFANLRNNTDKGILGAAVYALNPAHTHIGGLPCYPTIRALPEVPELLVIAVPGSLTLELVREAAESGVKAVIMVSSGYAEAGRRDLERKIGETAADYGMRILGPNTIGLLDTQSGVDSLFLKSTKTLPGGGEIASLRKPLKGGVVIVTQSGHLGEIVSEELAANGVGIRALVGTGNQLDVSVEDIVEYFADDAHTTVITIYLEGLSDGRRFMQVAAVAAKKKPVVVFKVGKTQVGARVALTHTASLVGDYLAYEAAFRQCGLIEAMNLHELVDYCVSLSMLPREAGKRLAIITNAGGVGAIAADEAQRSGLDVRPMRAGAVRQMRSEFQGSGFISNAALGNPIDLTASVSTEEFVRITESVLSLPDFDLALLLPTHQAPSMDYDLSSRLSEVISKARKPTAVCVMGESELANRIHSDFLERGIPSFPTPERAVRALAAASSYETLRSRARPPAAVRMTDRLRELTGFRGPLPQPEASRLLRAYGILQPKSAIVRSQRDIRAAAAIGFPVACKLLSSQLIHKTEAGGVVLNVADKGQLERVFSRFKKLAAEGSMPFDGMLVQEMLKGGTEILLGGTGDQTFGPMILFGFGGTYTELIRDYSLAVAPVTPREAREMIKATKLSPVLEGYRGAPVADINKLCKVIASFSKVMAENPSIEQMEINPLIVSERGIIAADARFIVAPHTAN